MKKEEKSYKEELKGGDKSYKVKNLDMARNKMNWHDVFVYRVILLISAFAVLIPLFFIIIDSKPGTAYAFLSLGIIFAIIGFFGKMWLRRIR